MKIKAEMPTLNLGRTMIIEIKLVNRIRLNNKECYGLTTLVKGDRAVITISKTIKDCWQFNITILHELLHVWLYILKSSAKCIDMRRAHTFIWAMEAVTEKLVRKILLIKGK